MPPGQVAAFGQQSVGTGRRQPVRVFQDLQGDADTVGNIGRPVGIVVAATAIQIQITAADIGEIDLVALGILEAVQAALGTAVAQGLPLLPVQGCKGSGLPEKVFGVGHKSFIGAW